MGIKINGAGGGGGGGGTSSSFTDLGNSGSSITVTLSDEKIALLTLTANCTITLATPSGPLRATLLIETGASGGFVPTLSQVNWSNGTTPTWNTAIHKINKVELEYNSTTGWIGTATLGHGDDRYPFDPSSLSGLQLWVTTRDASTLPSALDNSAQSTWNDKSLNAYSFQQATGANQPIYHSSGFGTNSLPYLHLNGTTQYMQTTANVPASLTGDLNVTEFLVIQPEVSTSDQALCGWGAGNLSQGFGLYWHMASNGNFDVSTGGGTQTAFSSTLNTNPNLITVTKSAGAYSSTSACRINGASQTQGASSGTPNVAANPFGIGIWSNFPSSGHFQGKIAEWVVYNRVLSGTEITQIESYLNGIYSIF